MVLRGIGVPAVAQVAGQQASQHRVRLGVVDGLRGVENLGLDRDLRMVAGLYAYERHQTRVPQQPLVAPWDFGRRDCVENG